MFCQVNLSFFFYHETTHQNLRFCETGTTDFGRFFVFATLGGWFPWPSIIKTIQKKEKENKKDVKVPRVMKQL